MLKIIVWSRCFMETTWDERTNHFCFSEIQTIDCWYRRCLCYYRNS